MSIDSRHYWNSNSSGDGGSFGGGFSLGMPKPTPAVKWLLIVNVVVFVVQLFCGRGELLSTIYSIFGVSLERFWAFWTYITFQFLHDGPWHIAMNMLGVYFFGTRLEQMWGSKAFLRFYLGCGAAAGLLYVIIGAIFGTNPATPLVGASGGVFGLLLACAVYCPQFKVIVLIFPAPIRFVAVVIFGLMGISVLHAAVNGAIAAVMSDVAHLGGALAAAFRIWAWPVVSEKASHAATDTKRGTWKRRLAKEAAEEKEVDRILEKIQREGIGSLNNAERQTLQQATENQRAKDRKISTTFKNR